MIDKIIVIDLIAVTENNAVQVRQATRIVEDGNVLSETYDRWVLAPGDNIDNQTQKVRAICNAVWNI